MKSFLVAIMLFGIAAPCSAGVVTKGQLKHNVVISDKVMSGGESNSILNFSLTTRLEADLSPIEADGFNSDTIVNGSFPLGPKCSFALTEDPAYQPGATSIKIADTVLYNNIEWQRSITMDWTAGKLKLNAKITAKPKLNDFANIEWQNLVKSKSKQSYTDRTLASIIAENQGIDFLYASTYISSKYKVSSSGKSDSKGTSKATSKQKISGNQIPPLARPEAE